MIPFVCPQCHFSGEVEDTFAGKKARCPRCATVVRLPAQTVDYVETSMGKPRSFTQETCVHSPKATSPGGELAPGKVLQNRYSIARVLGRGGMGEVYLARDLSLQRTVALKVIRPRDPSLRERTIAEQNLREAFIEEARVGANLAHPGIASVFDFGIQDCEPFIVFEYVGGETLAESIHRRGRLPLDEVRLILAPLVQALQSAHACGIVHRDLKPANIRSTALGHYKILDLGLARDFQQVKDWRFAGTPRYASPEQAAGLPCDGRTDQYALALIAFEMLTGRPVFEANKVEEMLSLQREQKPPSLRTFLPDAPESVAQALARALAKDPNQRFASCEEFANALGCQFLTDSVRGREVLLLAKVAKMKGIWSNAWVEFSPVRQKIYLALVTDCLWVSYREAIRQWPLSAVELDNGDARSRWLRLRVEGKSQAFLFRSTRHCKDWKTQIQTLQKTLPQPESGAARAESDKAIQKYQHVVFLRRQPPIRCQTLGNMDLTNSDRRLAALGLKVQAALKGADAVMDVQEERVPGLHQTRWRRSGTAIRVVDSQGRHELIARWFGQETQALSKRLLILLAVRLVLAILTGVFLLPHDSSPSFLQALALGVGGNLAFHVLPFALVLWLRVTQIPQLVRPALFCILALVLVQGLVALGFMLVQLVRGAQIPELAVWILLDPFNLVMIVLAGYYLHSGMSIYREYEAAVSETTEAPAKSRQIAAALGWTLMAVFALAAVWISSLGAASWSTWSMKNLVQERTSPQDRPILTLVPDPMAEKLTQAAAKSASATSKLLNAPLVAEAEFKDALAILQSVGPLPPDAPQGQAVRHDIASCHSNIGIAQLLTGKLVDAEQNLTLALKEFEALDLSWQDKAVVRRNLGMTYLKIGMVRMQTGRQHKAIAEFRQALASFKGLDASDEITYWQANCYHNIGACLVLAESAGALPELRTALQRYTQLSEKQQNSPPVQFDLAGCRFCLAQSLLQQKQTPEAATQLRLAIQIYETLAVQFPQDASVRAQVQRARGMLKTIDQGIQRKAG